MRYMRGGTDQVIAPLFFWGLTMSMITPCKTAIILAMALLVAMHAVAVSADTSNGTPTPAVEGTPTPAVTSTALYPEEESVVTPTTTISSTVAATPTITPTLDIEPTATPTSTPVPLPTSTPIATAAPEPTPTVTPPSTDTTYIAVLVSETVIPVGGAASSEVFISLIDVESDIQRIDLVLVFDPTIVRAAGQDDVQIPTNAALDVDNQGGEIVLSLTATEDSPIQSTNSWAKVATITWMALQEGKSVVTVSDATQFVTSDGEALSPDATYDGVVFARAPGTIQGRVQLQGRETHDGILVSSSLSSVRFDRERTEESGRFAITTSHGEGFYTIVVAMPGYLGAESDRPIKMTVDSVIDVGEVMLYGGDVNSDNRIDIRDLAYVAWSFDKYDAKADINRDGQVDILDLTLTAGNFGRLGPTIWHISDQENK
jgi:hypothetical protein